MAHVPSPQGPSPAQPSLLQAMQRRKRRTVVIASPGSEELRFLDAMEANADCGGESLTHIILRPDARKIEALEEYLHGTQMRIGLIGQAGDRQPEVHVKEFMIRHAKLLGITAEDAFVLKQLLGGQAV